MQHWIDRAAYWRERAEKAEAALKNAVAFDAEVAGISGGEIRLVAAGDAPEYPAVGTRVEVRLRPVPTE
jgi:hypothetical protein